MRSRAGRSREKSLALAATVLFTIALCAPFSVSAAEGFDWNRPKDRLLLDRSLRKLSEQCSQLGFTPLAAPSPDSMEKRIYSRFLLKPKYQANMEAERWMSWFLELLNLGKPDRIEMAAERGGAALAAAAVDPSAHEAARTQFVESSVMLLRPVLAACQQAVADEFVGAHYLNGTGSLKSFETSASEAFDKQVSETAAYARELEKGARK